MTTEVCGSILYTLLRTTMKKIALASIPALSALLSPLLLVPRTQASDAEIRIICSNGIKGAMDKLIPQYVHTSGQHIAIQYGASALLKGAIEGGAPFDLAILTPGVIDDLTKAGKIAAGTHTDIARADIGVGVRAGAPKTDISTPDAMKRRLLAAKSITFAKEGAATAAINNMFERLGIAADLKSKIVFQPVGGKAEESVASGENELVFGPVSEIIPVHGVEVLGVFPSEFQSPLIMTAGLGAKAENAEAAKALVKFLTSSAAAPTLKAAGMEPASKKK
jgi:molybdate transport system substrate-binding protein